MASPQFRHYSVDNGLDNFKGINDSFGHASCDTALIAAAQRLGAVTREVDVAARLGGDEFAILLEGTSASAWDARSTHATV